MYMSDIVDEIQAEIFQIQYLKKKNDADVDKKIQELIKTASKLENYEAIYRISKKMATTPEEFNLIMLTVRKYIF